MTSGSRDDPIPRRAARVLVLDHDDRLLMLRGCDPARPDWRYWFTVGGGLDSGESFLDAGVRELREETGLSVPASQLAGPIWQETTDYPFDGRWYRQEQKFFVVRVPETAGWEFTTAGFDAEEHSSIDGHGWWSVRDLRNTTERFYPPTLAELLTTILEA